MNSTANSKFRRTFFQESERRSDTIAEQPSYPNMPGEEGRLNQRFAPTSSEGEAPLKVSRLTQHESPRQSFQGEVGRGYQRFAPASSAGKAPLEVSCPVRNDAYDRIYVHFAPLQGASHISGRAGFIGGKDTSGG